TIHPKRFDVVELLHQPGKVTVSVPVAVAERLEVHLIDNCVLVPESVVAHARFLGVVGNGSLLHASSPVMVRSVRGTRAPVPQRGPASRSCAPHARCTLFP